MSLGGPLLVADAGAAMGEQTSEIRQLACLLASEYIEGMLHCANGQGLGSLNLRCLPERPL